MRLDDPRPHELCRRAAAAWVPLLLALVPAAEAADAGAKTAPAAERAVTLESVAGSPLKRVVLSARAAQRLDVQTREVIEQRVVPTLAVGGVVVDASAAGSATAAGEAWIRVAISPVEWDKMARDQDVRIRALATRAALAPDLSARPGGRAPLDNARSGMLTLFYVAARAGSGLVPGDRVRVEVPLTGSPDTHKVVPYSAVYHDANGEAWVYVNTAPLSFLRARVGIERVVGDLALLSSGPAVGTRVATVGVSLLYGAEVFGK